MPWKYFNLDHKTQYKNSNPHQNIREMLQKSRHFLSLLSFFNFVPWAEINFNIRTIFAVSIIYSSSLVSNISFLHFPSHAHPSSSYAFIKWKEGNLHVERIVLFSSSAFKTWTFAVIKKIYPKSMLCAKTTSVFSEFDIAELQQLSNLLIYIKTMLGVHRYQVRSNSTARWRSSLVDWYTHLQML